jgi:hypothetical protein
MVGHFPTNIHMGAFVFIANIAQHKSIPKPNLGFKNPWHVLACEKPCHYHLKMTKSIGLVLIKFGAPNNVMLGKEH